MDKYILLQEVNRLIESDLRKSALDLLTEYLEYYPDDASVLRAAGKIYLLEKQPQKAAEHLQRALKSVQSSELTYDHHDVPYEIDQLNYDDLEYIDQNANENYLIDTDQHEQNFENLYTEEQTSLKISKNLAEYQQSSLNFSEEQTSHYIDSYDKPLDAYDEDCPDSQLTDLLKSNFEYQPDDFLPFKDELNELSQTIDDDLAVLDQASIDEEFDWETIEDFGDSDNNIHDILVDGSTKISRSERAKQIAVAVMSTHHWDIKNIGLLQQVFYENGWGAARVAIEREIQRGLMPEELELAVFVRKLWTENPQYWISFIHVKSSLEYQTTRDAYKNMSWSEALRVVRLFNSLPCDTEIQNFIDTIYDDWYCSTRLQRQFKSFMHYLKSHTSCTTTTSEEDNPFALFSMYEEATILEKPYHEIRYVKNIETLKPDYYLNF